MVRARTLKVALAASGLVAAFIGFVGAAHTPWGRPMLAWLQGAPGCPIGADLDPAAVAAVRAQLIAPLADVTGPQASSVLAGLQPGHSSRADARRWASDHGLACLPMLAARHDRCEGDLLGYRGASIVLHYENATLLDVEASFRSDDADVASSMAETLEAALGGGAQPWREQGANDAQTLAVGPLSQRRHEYRFSDLRTEVRATNLGPRGYLVRGFAQSLPTDETDAAPAS